MSEIFYVNLLLMLARISSFFSATPLFSSRAIPMLVKTAIIALVTVIASMTVPITEFEMNGAIDFGMMIVREALIGVVVGYTVNIIFLGIQSAGDIIDLFAGLQMSSIYDPVTGTNGTFYSNIYNWIATLIFFNMKGHHYLITGVVNSFLFIPVGKNVLFEMDLSTIADLLSKTVYVSIQLGFPLAVILFLVDIILGMVCRIVPQINVFVLGMPIKLALSSMLFILMTTGIMNGVSWGIEIVIETFDTIIKSIV